MATGMTFKKLMTICALFLGLFMVIPAYADIPGAPHKVYIIYHPNGGSGTMPTQSANHYASVTLRANKFKRPGYVFAGWMDDMGNTYSNKARVENVGLGLVLYAQWNCDEYKLFGKAHVYAGYLTSRTTDAYGKIILKTGRRNNLTLISKFSATVVWPGTTQKITMKGSSSDGNAVLSGGGKTLQISVNGTSFSCSDGDIEAVMHIAGNEGEDCMLNDDFEPSTYSCTALPPVHARRKKWIINNNYAQLRLTFNKNTFEFFGSFTDLCSGRKVKRIVSGVAFDSGGYGYAYGDGYVYPFRLVYE